ncbi:hypothetical protein, partial [[Eubacterium] cellulosolvens]
MGLSLVRKLFCIIIVLLLLLPVVAALDVGNETKNDNSKDIYSDSITEESKTSDIEVEQCLIPSGSLSVEVAEILERYSQAELDQALKDYLVEFNEEMLVRRQKFTAENPGLPYMPLDITKLLVKLEPETGELVSAFPGAELSNEMERIKFSFDSNSPIISAFNQADPFYKPLGTIPTQNTPSTRGARDVPEVDLELSMLEWSAVNEGWGNRYDDEEPGFRPYLG